MNPEELVRLTDQLLYSVTGKHLTYLESQILLGVLDRQPYTTIAIAQNCTEGHIRDVAYKLWRQLALIFKEPVSKVNLIAVLSRAFPSFVSSVEGSEASDYHGEVCQFNSNPIRPRPSYIEIISKLKDIGLSSDQIHAVLRILRSFDLIEIHDSCFDRLNTESHDRR